MTRRAAFSVMVWWAALVVTAQLWMLTTSKES
jgi:hypothetical protein